MRRARMLATAAAKSAVAPFSMPVSADDTCCSANGNMLSGNASHSTPSAAVAARSDRASGPRAAGISDSVRKPTRMRTNVTPFGPRASSPSAMNRNDAPQMTPGRISSSESTTQYDGGFPDQGQVNVSHHVMTPRRVQGTATRTIRPECRPPCSAAAYRTSARRDTGLVNQRGSRRPCACSPHGRRSPRQSKAMNTCDRPVSCSGAAGISCVARPPASSAADHVEHERRGRIPSRIRSAAAAATLRSPPGRASALRRGRTRPGPAAARRADGRRRAHRRRTATSPCRARRGPRRAGTAMTSGLLPMRGVSAPHGGRLGIVLVQQTPMTPASAACQPYVPPRIQ